MRYTAEPNSRSIPGVPSGAGLLGPLGALVGGVLTGVVVGLSAGPIGLRVGAAVGGVVGLLGFAAVHMRGPLRARTVLRFFMRLFGWSFAVAGGGATVLTGFLMNDNPTGEPNAPLACGAFAVALFCGASILLASSRRRYSGASTGF
jgi:hypothetical protein